jgi:hypothetical protein
MEQQMVLRGYLELAKKPRLNALRNAPRWLQTQVRQRNDYRVSQVNAAPHRLAGQSFSSLDHVPRVRAPT